MFKVNGKSMGTKVRQPTRNAYLKRIKAEAWSKRGGSTCAQRAHRIVRFYAHVTKCLARRQNRNCSVPRRILVWFNRCNQKVLGVCIIVCPRIQAYKSCLCPLFHPNVDMNSLIVCNLGFQYHDILGYVAVGNTF